MAEGAWNHTAWACAMIEAAHATKTTKFNPDKWHPMKTTTENLSTGQKRMLARDIVANMPDTFEEFKKLKDKR